MSKDTVLTHWDETHSSLWGHKPIRIAHNLHKSPLFSMDALAKLIERYPREHYNLVQTGVARKPAGLARRRYRQSLAAGR